MYTMKNTAKEELKKLNDWQFNDNGIEKNLFSRILAAPGFIIQIGLRAENKDIIQNYSMCITNYQGLSTHDAND
jgi:pterin-4a-carbinolamine dehydratase